RSSDLIGNAKIDPSVRMYGPVKVMNDVTVQAGVIIFGPAVLEQGVKIGRDSFVENSVVWSGATIGPRCEIRNCVVGHQASVPAESVLADTGMVEVSPRRKIKVESFKPKAEKASRIRKRRSLSREAEISPTEEQHEHVTLGVPLMLSAGFSLLLIGLIAAYWNVLADVWRIWISNAEYSAGIAVPFLALFVLWSRREKIRRCVIGPSYWGIAGIAVSSAVMAYGIIYNNVTAQRISFIMAVASVVLFLFGRQLFVKTATVLLFLMLMFPMPQSVHDSVLLPAQRFSVSSAEFCLQCMGMYASSTGDILNVDRALFAVGPGCSGLRMVSAFFIVSAMIALLIRRSIWEKMLVLVSSIPIAMFCNTLRITLAGAGAKMLAENIEWQNLLHTAGGYAMIPVAMMGLMGELWLVSKLLPVKTERPAVNNVSIKWEST
ncbi:MAG: exosortase, partial [Phycisphaerae bacterium]